MKRVPQHVLTAHSVKQDGLIAMYYYSYLILLCFLLWTFSVIAAVAWLHRFRLVAWCCYFYPAQTMATLSVSWSSYDTSANEKGHAIFCSIVRNSSQINAQINWTFSLGNRFAEEKCCSRTIETQWMCVRKNQSGGSTLLTGGFNFKMALDLNLNTWRWPRSEHFLGFTSN